MAKKQPSSKTAGGTHSTSKSETSEGTKERPQSRTKKVSKDFTPVVASESRPNAIARRLKASIVDDAANATNLVPTPSYQLDENDLLDPGAQIVRACGEVARRHVEDGAELARKYATIRLLEKLIGTKQRFQPARAQIQWRGTEGQQMPAGVRITSKDGRLATSNNEAFTLGRITRVLGIGESSVIEFPLFADKSAEDKLFEDSWKVSKLRVEYSFGSTSPDDVLFPGLLWNLAPPLSCRITSVASADGAEMEWRLDHAGRLIVPNQRASLFSSKSHSTHPTHWVDIQCHVEPGEARHIPPPLLNVSEVVETIGKSVFMEIELSTFETPINRLPGICLEQPFSGANAVPEEDDESWMRRASNAVRHGSRAVIPQDYVDIAADHVPDVQIVEVKGTRVPAGCGFEDAVRLTVIPTHWESLTDFLSRALVGARRLESIFQGKTPLGVKGIAGPPSIIVPETPGCSDPLWLFRDFLVAYPSSPPKTVCRRDGVYWPLLTLANLRKER